MRTNALLFVLASSFFACSSAVSDGTTRTTTASVTAGIPSAQLDFEAGWVQQQRGAIVRGGHVDVVHDASRLASCPGSTVFSFARFLPGGQLSSSDEAFGFDVPTDATSVELWFHAVAPGCEAWDSNYGANWSFPVVASSPPAVGWVGDWGSLTTSACTRTTGVPEPLVIDSTLRKSACLDVEADVWVPGVTDVPSPHPEWIQAAVSYAKDGGAAVQQNLAYEGIVGHNARFRWSIPAAIRDQADWNTVTYSFGFMSDGVHTTNAAQASGADRTLQRAFSL